MFIPSVKPRENDKNAIPGYRCKSLMPRVNFCAVDVVLFAIFFLLLGFTLWCLLLRGRCKTWARHVLKFNLRPRRALSTTTGLKAPSRAQRTKESMENIESPSTLDPYYAVPLSFNSKLLVESVLSKDVPGPKSVVLSCVDPHSLSLPTTERGMGLGFGDSVKIGDHPRLYSGSGEPSVNKPVRTSGPQSDHVVPPPPPVHIRQTANRTS